MNHIFKLNSNRLKLEVDKNQTIGNISSNEQQKQEINAIAPAAELDSINKRFDATHDSNPKHSNEPSPATIRNCNLMKLCMELCFLNSDESLKFEF